MPLRNETQRRGLSGAGRSTSAIQAAASLAFYAHLLLAGESGGKSCAASESGMLNYARCGGRQHQPRENMRFDACAYRGAPRARLSGPRPRSQTRGRGCIPMCARRCSTGTAAPAAAVPSMHAICARRWSLHLHTRMRAPVQAQGARLLANPPAIIAVALPAARRARSAIQCRVQVQDHRLRPPAARSRRAQGVLWAPAHGRP